MVFIILIFMLSSMVKMKIANFGSTIGKVLSSYRHGYAPALRQPPYTVDQHKLSAKTLASLPVFL